MNLKRLAAGLVAAAIGAVVAAVGAYAFFFSDAPDEVNLESALEAAAATPDASSTAAAAPASASTDGDLTGTWTVATDGSSFVGYRVQEELANVGAATAVGRTESVTGSLEFDGAAITAVSIEADLAALTSDQDRRDQALRRQALETATFPTATFVLTEQIPLDGIPAEGETIAVEATGALTVHGVTQTVTIPLEGAFVDGRVVVVGSTVIQFADYDIAQPEAMSVLSVDDKATLELQLVFVQA